MRGIFRKIFFALMLTGIIATGAACLEDTAAAAQQCVFITGDGVNDSGEIKRILYPGDKVAKGDDEDWYVPCNSRNYITTLRDDAGDHHTAYSGQTAKGENGEPANDILVDGISMYWALNQKESALREFFPFCQKYACAGVSQSQDQNQAATNFATEGWNSMLRENFSFVNQRAVGVALQSFPRDLPDRRDLWDDFGEAVAEEWMTEMGKTTGWNPDEPWFCASGGDLKSVCNPVRFTVESIQYSDESLRGQQAAEASHQRQLDDIERANELAEVQHQADLRAKQREIEIAAEEGKKYTQPGYAEARERQHQERMMELCAATQKCVVVNGSGSGIQIQG